MFNRYEFKSSPCTVFGVQLIIRLHVADPGSILGQRDLREGMAIHYSSRLGESNDDIRGSNQ